MRKTLTLYEFAFASAVVVFVLNLAVLAVWQFDFASLQSFFPDQQIANPVTSLCFILSLVSLFLSASAAKKARWMGQLIVLPVLVIAATVFGSFAFHFPTSLDKWLFAKKLYLYGNRGRPNYMAPNTAFCFIALSLSLIWFTYKKNNAKFVADILALLCSVVSFTSIVGYLYGASEFYSVKFYIPIAFPSALSFFLLCLAILFYRNRYGVFNVFTSPYLGTKVARFLIPCALIIPVILGELRIKAERAALFSSTFGVAVLVTSNVLIFIVLIWRVSVYLNRTSRQLSLEIKEKERLHRQVEKFNCVLARKIDERTHQLIEQAVAHRKELLQNGIEVQEKAKKEIGMELHDNVNQVLASVGLLLDIAINSPHLRDQMMRKSKKHLNEAINEIRTLSKTLVPHSIAAGNLRECILEMIAPVEVSRNIHFDVCISGNLSSFLNTEQLITIYRIVQEQLNNILKYADASNVLIKIGEREKMLELSIKDDGKGFDLSEKRKGIGLSNIESRAILFNGGIRIFSSPGNGCEIQVAFPLSKFT